MATPRESTLMEVALTNGHEYPARQFDTPFPLCSVITDSRAARHTDGADAEREDQPLSDDI
jgi:hypothetical protein